MKKLVMLFLLLFVALICCFQMYSCTPNEIKPSEINGKIPAYKLHADIDEFIKVLEEVHVNPYMKISRGKFNNATIELKNSIIDSLTIEQFYRAFTPLVDKLNDSHTGVKFPEEIWKHYQYNIGGLFFPMEIATTTDKRIFIKRDFSENSIPNKTEILSINSINSKEIINTFLKYEHSPIESSSIKRLERKFVDYLWWILDFKGPFTVETNIGTFNIEGHTWAEYEKNWNLFRNSNNLSKEKIILNEVDAATCILKITSYSGSLSEFKNQIEEQFKIIQAKGYENLILDVRDNGGGNDENGRTVIDFITEKPYSEALASTFMMKRSRRYEQNFKSRFPRIIRWAVSLRTVSWFNKEYKKLFKHLIKTPYGENLIAQLPLQELTENPYRFNGNVYVLSNHNSYSATTVFLGAIKDYKIGTIIGTETGDCPTGFGQNLYFELENSRLRCHSSTTFMIRPNGDTDMSHGVKPDYYVEQTIDDVEKNIDTILNYTFDLIENTKRNIRK